MNQSGNQLVHDLLLQAARLQHLQHEHAHDHDSTGHGHEHDHEHEHGHEHEEDEAGELLIAKITAMCVLFAASTICGCTPFLLNRWFQWTKSDGSVRSATVVKGLLYFGGGVLLCTTFLHLVPEVSHNIEVLQKCGMLPTLTFNLAHLLMCIGFFAMYLVEEIVHKYLHYYRKTADAAQQAFERGRSVRESALVRGRAETLPNNNENNPKKEIISNDDLENQKQVEIKDTQKPPVYMNGHSQKHRHDPGHSHMPNISEDTIVSSLRGLLIVLALSLHELFEGLAVGLEGEPSRVWYMFGAVSAHKLVLAFCVGVELIVTRTKLWLAILYVLTFAVVSPLGIGIGIYVSSDDNMASTIPSAILQGLASGTLLYVVFFEILSKERSGLIAYLAFIVGFAVMFGLQFATSSSHGHSHGSCGHDHGEEGHEHIHGPEHLLMVTADDEKLKLIKEATEELAHALSTKIK